MPEPDAVVPRFTGIYAENLLSGSCRVRAGTEVPGARRPGEDVIRALRWIGASLLGLLGGLLGLVGAVLCVTIVLAPLGIPILFLARRLFRTAGQLVVPRGVRHPIDTLTQAASDNASDLSGSARKLGRRARKKAKKKAKKAKKAKKSL